MPWHHAASFETSWSAIATCMWMTGRSLCGIFCLMVTSAKRRMISVIIVCLKVCQLWTNSRSKWISKYFFSWHLQYAPFEMVPTRATAGHPWMSCWLIAVSCTQQCSESVLAPATRTPFKICLPWAWSQNLPPLLFYFIFLKTVNVTLQLWENLWWGPGPGADPYCLGMAEGRWSHREDCSAQHHQEMELHVQTAPYWLRN